MSGAGIRTQNAIIGSHPGCQESPSGGSDGQSSWHRLGEIDANGCPVGGTRPSVDEFNGIAGALQSLITLSGTKPVPNERLCEKPSMVWDSIKDYVDDADLLLDGRLDAHDTKLSDHDTKLSDYETRLDELEEGGTYDFNNLGKYTFITHVTDIGNFKGKAKIYKESNPYDQTFYTRITLGQKCLFLGNMQMLIPIPGNSYPGSFARPSRNAQPPYSGYTAYPADELGHWGVEGNYFNAFIYWPGTYEFNQPVSNFVAAPHIPGSPDELNVSDQYVPITNCGILIKLE